jgi:hypothetical protein
MKKYFSKFIVLLILAAVLPMTGGLCLHDLMGSATKINIAEAAENTIVNNSDNSSISNGNICHNSGARDFVMGNQLIKLDKISNALNMAETMPPPMPNSGNSVLPCCVGGSQPSVVVSSQSVEIHKFIPFIRSIFEKLPLNIAKPISYLAPITAPPELISLQTTILRI